MTRRKARRVPSEAEVPSMWNDPRWKAYMTRVRTELVPKIDASAMGLSIVPTNPADVDVKFAVELGLLIMLGKPLLLVADPGTVLPPKLALVADEIVTVDRDAMNDPEAQERLQAAIKRIRASLEGGRSDP
jgi:nucleoside 2-deoxyribosyltransferase